MARRWPRGCPFSRLFSLSAVRPLLALPSAGAAAGWFAGLPLNFLLGRAFRLFNEAFARATNVYLRGVGILLRTSALVLAVYCGLLGLTAWSYSHTPKGFVPTQDMGYLLVAFQLPDAASTERTVALTNRVEGICKTVRGVKNSRGVQRPIVPVERQRLELQLDVRDARRFRGAADGRYVGRRDRRPAAANAQPAKCPRPRWSSWGRRPSAASAARAGSSSWWKTAATWA